MIITGLHVYQVCLEQLPLGLVVSEYTSAVSVALRGLGFESKDEYIQEYPGNYKASSARYYDNLMSLIGKDKFDKYKDSAINIFDDSGIVTHCTLDETPLSSKSDREELIKNGVLFPKLNQVLNTDEFNNEPIDNLWFCTNWKIEESTYDDGEIEIKICNNGVFNGVFAGHKGEKMYRVIDINPSELSCKKKYKLSYVNGANVIQDFRIIPDTRHGYGLIEIKDNKGEWNNYENIGDGSYSYGDEWEGEINTFWKASLCEVDDNNKLIKDYLIGFVTKDDLLFPVDYDGW